MAATGEKAALMLKRCMLVLLILYGLLLLYWMFIGFGRTHSITGGSYRYNITPFQTIKLYMQIHNFNRSTWAINMLGNIGVFIPFGFLPYAIRLSYIRLIIGSVLTILLLEGLQMVSYRGSFDIDDIILNVIGITIGYAGYVGLYFLHRSMKRPH